jgi:hypothetical protein
MLALYPNDIGAELFKAIVPGTDQSITFSVEDEVCGPSSIRPAELKRETGLARIQIYNPPTDM